MNEFREKFDTPVQIAIIAGMLLAVIGLILVIAGIRNNTFVNVMSGFGLVCYLWVQTTKMDI